ncbi:hypothetical protein [Acidipropionibacterium timonense]|uniref:hypothetical protein n=1 Tax=Acidipropionibacterium timonense TaxID=2161818 RepID=UPI0010308879|nr:hypothetical protein [Acidipropionibacterium timonense]
MKIHKGVTASITVLIALAGCGGSGSSSTGAGATTPSPAMSATSAATGQSSSVATASASEDDASSMTAMAVAKMVAAKKPGSKIVEYTEDNDPNNLLGRPNGYTAAANIQWIPAESGAGELDVSRGASVEQWATNKDAVQRAKYLQTIFKSAPAFGSEYSFVKGPILLRVTGAIKPSQAKTLNVIDGDMVTAD